MSFVHYRIILKLLSPLHIGKRKYRNLMETREYVSGRTLWGALTARITKDYFNGETDKYGKVGTFLIENFRFGYLWPAVEVEKSQNQFEIRKFKVYFPWESEKKVDKEKHGKLGFSYEFIGSDYFDYLFKFSCMGQSIDYSRKATEEGLLYEVEFIGSKTRENQQVYLIGDIWIKKDVLEDEKDGKVRINSKVIPLKDVFTTIQLGGERNYGWGKVKVENFERLKNSKALGNIDVEINNEVFLKFEKGDRVTAHVVAAEWEFQREGKNEKLLPVSGLEGEIEPWAGYAYQVEKGWHIPPPPVCFLPGSLVKTSTKLKVSIYGLLSK